MAGGPAIFQPAYDFVDGKLDTFLTQDAGQVMAQVAGPLRVALVLYVLLYGVAILRGAIQEPLVDFAIRAIKLALIVMLATTQAYGSWVATPLFHTLPDTLSAAISGQPPTTAGASFDQFFDRVGYLGEKISKEASPVNWTPLLVSGAVWVIGALAAALGFGIFLLSKVALALLIALGPIFVACALFEVSRRYFFGWLSQAVNYLVLLALIVTIFQLILSLVGAQWGSIDGQDPVAGGLLFIALCLLATIFFLQVPAIAAGIAGGASAGLADFGNAAAMAMQGRAPFSSQSTGGGRAQTPRQGGSLRPVRAKI
ncbi:type IV secretion system protein [Phenylobacterium sp.]|uniref:type IV secretion system protein n=1 Tax=Phenylobacterium sp. TaxID=1871053 RepID=UPI0035684DBD